LLKKAFSDPASKYLHRPTSSLSTEQALHSSTAACQRKWRKRVEIKKKSGVEKKNEISKKMTDKEEERNFILGKHG
jgi:hypothetical protein